MNEGELGRIISLIMENPTLLDEIKRLAMVDNGEKIKEGEEVGKEDEPMPTSAPITENKPPRVIKSRRRELLSALSPYISENRRRAIESFMTIADILELMRGK